MPLDRIRSMSVKKVRDELIALQASFINDGKLDAEVDKLLRENPEPAKLVKAANERFQTRLTLKDLATKTQPGKSQAPVQDEDGDGSVDTRDILLSRARQYMRKELTDLEQFVLIQIFDNSWKDHLYAMDILKSSIGLHAFAEKDPRILFKKEGFRYFEEMMAGVRDKVTDLIFRARVVGEAQRSNAYRETAATHADTGGYGVSENIRATADVVPGGGEMQEASSGGGATATKPIVREGDKVGRNDPCPCGSGKKYKKCCGVGVA
jgi:preprotein translocase subunit SecA